MIMEYITSRFESVAEFSGYLSKGETQPYFKDDPSSQDEDRPTWHGTKSYAEADRLFKCGDTETKRRIETAAGGAAKLSSFGVATQTSRVRAMTGYKVSIGAYLSGSPKCFIKRAKVERMGRTATIVFNLTYPCYVDVQDMAKTAACLVKAVLRTERERGIKFNVYVTFCTRSSGTTAISLVKVKSSSQWFNLNTMAYSLANPSMLRRHFFRWLEVTPNIPYGFVSGYGNIVSEKDKIGQAINAAGVKYDYILDGYTMLGKTPEQIHDIINS